jgi:hypothetical protein
VSVTVFRRCRHSTAASQSGRGAGAALELAAPTTTGATITGFTIGDTIDLVNVVATKATLNKFDQLIVFNGATRVSTLQLSGAYHGETFAVVSDGNGGSAVTISGGGTAAPAAVFAQAMVGLGGGAFGPPVVHGVQSLESVPMRLPPPDARSEWGACR